MLARRPESSQQAGGKSTVVAIKTKHPTKVGLRGMYLVFKVSLAIHLNRRWWAGLGRNRRISLDIVIEQDTGDDHSQQRDRQQHGIGVVRSFGFLGHGCISSDQADVS
jgi:hypothetical protein